MAFFHIAAYKLSGSNLEMETKEKIDSHEYISVILQDRSLKKDLFYQPEIIKVDNTTTIIKLDLSLVDFYKRKKNTFDVFVLIGNIKYRALSESVFPKQSSRFCTSMYKISHADVAVPYLTVNNSLSILYGNASVIFKQFCREIIPNDKIDAKILNKDHSLSIDFRKITFNKDNSFLAYFDYEKKSYISLHYTRDKEKADRIYIDKTQLESGDVKACQFAIQQKYRSVLVTKEIIAVNEYNGTNEGHNNPLKDKAIIKNYMSIGNILYQNKKISFEIDAWGDQSVEGYSLFFKDKQGRTYFPEVKHHEHQGTMKFEIYLNTFINEYAKDVSKWAI